MGAVIQSDKAPHRDAIFERGMLGVNLVRPARGIFLGIFLRSSGELRDRRPMLMPRKRHQEQRGAFGSNEPSSEADSRGIRTFLKIVVTGEWCGGLRLDNTPRILRKPFEDCVVIDLRLEASSQ